MKSFVQRIFLNVTARTTSRIPKKKAFPSRKKGAFSWRLWRFRGLSPLQLVPHFSLIIR